MASLFSGMAYPSLREDAAARGEATRVSQLQNAMMQSPGGTAAAGTVGSTLASEQGKANVQALAGAAQAQAQSTATDVGLAKGEAAADVGAEQRRNMLRVEANKAKLAKIDSGLATQMSGDTSDFIVDSARNKYMNEHMLMEWKLKNAKNQAEVQKYVQDHTNLMERKLKMMETVSIRMREQIQLETESEQSKLSMEQKKKLVEISQMWDRKMEEERARQARKSGLHGMVNAVGSGLLASGNPYAMAAGAAVLAVENIGSKDGEGNISGAIGG